jgi:uncharacterized cupredoxin-like copper-binding protein
MTIVTDHPSAQALPQGGVGSDLETQLREELDAAHRRWEAAESTRSALTVFSIVVAGMALIASIVAWGFASQRNATPSAAPAVAPVSAFSAVQVPVTVTDFNIAVPAVTLTAGTKTLQISNGGAQVHEVLIFHPAASIDPKNLPVDSAGNVIEDAPGLNKMSDGDNIDAGKSQSRPVDLTQPGTYVFVCNLAGHYKMGMHTIVTVVAPPA